MDSQMEKSWAGMVAANSAVRKKGFLKAYLLRAIVLSSNGPKRYSSEEQR
jgi:hypothetical protein